MSKKQKDPYDQLVDSFIPVGMEILNFYTKSFLEHTTKSSMDGFSILDSLPKEHLDILQETLNLSFAEILSGFSEKFNLVMFHVLLAIISGRSKDVKSFETRLAHLLRTTITKS